ncbi:MAG: type I DNA topoisomerase [Christensenellales bacterium]
MAEHKLVIVESPAKARTIGKYLGRGYKVEASNGHVRDLPKSQIGVDIENGFEPKYITIRGRGDVLQRIRKEAKGASKIFLATDPDREGEAISWHLANVLNIAPDDLCRVEFHEITSKAVKSAMKSPRKIDADLVDAQQARRVLDRLVGYKISPLLWAKVRKGLSAGRVQSVAARMIVDREQEISDFEPEEYWVLTGIFSLEARKFKAKYVGMNGDKAAVGSGEEAEDIVRRAKGEEYAVRTVRRGERRKLPTPPFTTSNLQQEASRKLNFTTSKTMQIAQQLYEGIDIAGAGTQGLVTYIRTDSTRSSDDAISAVRDRILEKYGAEYVPAEPNKFRTRNTAQDAHEAIRPTNLEFEPDAIKPSLTRDQYKLYKLIYERFVASQMAPAVYATMAADIAGGDISFHFSGQKKSFPGFTALYEEGQDDAQQEEESAFPDIREGDRLNLDDIESLQRFTQPPPRYTEASLVRELEEKGIGRPSTYAPTISTIIARGYIAREKKRLFPTELGFIVTDILKKHFPNIVDIAFTADMEEKLDGVEEGKLKWREVIAEFYEPFAETLERAQESIEKIEIKDEVSDVQCEKCGAMMVYKMGRYGKFLACPNFPACRNTMAILKDTGATCPNCGGRILERMSKKGRRFFGCEKYPECDFVSWDMPSNEKCPACGGRMVVKRDKKGAIYLRCVNEQCRHRVVLENTNDE